MSALRRAWVPCATLVLASALLFGVAGCAKKAAVDGSGDSQSSANSAAPGQIPQSEARAVLDRVAVSMGKSDVPPADVDLYSYVLSALEAKAAETSASNETTGLSQAGAQSAVALWRKDFKFADNSAVVRRWGELQDPLTESSSASDAEVVVWAIYQKVTPLLATVSGAKLTPEADGWVVVTPVAAAGESEAEPPFRVHFTRSGDSWRIDGVDMTP